MAARSDGYAAKSRTLLAQASEELEQGELTQASEKLWGATAQMVKAVAQRRGWRHDSHRRLLEVVNRLASETGDRNLITLFQVAGSLHFNFYETEFPREFIEVGAERVEELIRKLEEL